MTESPALKQDELIERLVDGFAALLKQVEVLKRHSEEVELLLGTDHKVPITVQNELDDTEVSLSNGMEALKTLKSVGREMLHKGSAQHEAVPIKSTDDDGRLSMPADHPAIDGKASQKMVCPFASMAQAQPAERQSAKLASARPQRPDSLPTPPETREQYIDGENFDQVRASQTSAPPSATGSFSKCPIRMLDERPPEEIAEYFETHKHEIPRSHEICVKRYQSNEHSIRQLDAKYGSLVNMIQGLGLKHQPLLHTRGGADVETKPGAKVEKWADNVEESPREAEIVSELQVDPMASEEREGHFDRPLKEIRVGESPSRPWGISVPVGPSHSDDDLADERTPGHMPKPKPSSFPQQKSGTPNKPSVAPEKEKPQVIFNGPVFIGYPPEQAAAFLKQSGMNV